MKNSLLLLFTGLFLVACKRNEVPDLDKPGFPFMKIGHQWNYMLVTESGETEISYKITDHTKENYFKVLLSFVNTEFPVLDDYWHADETTFSMSTDWPNSNLKFTMLKKDSKVGDVWQYELPLDPTGDDLSGTLKYSVVEVNSVVTAAGKTYSDVFKVRHTASSHPQYFADYFISKSGGIVKMQGMGYARIDEEEPDIIYFPLEWKLKSKNF